MCIEPAGDKGPFRWRRIRRRTWRRIIRGTRSNTRTRRGARTRMSRIPVAFASHIEPTTACIYIYINVLAFCLRRFYIYIYIWKPTVLLCLMDTLWPVATKSQANASALQFPLKGTLQPALEPDIGGKPQPGPPIGAMAP